MDLGDILTHTGYVVSCGLRDHDIGRRRMRFEGHRRYFGLGPVPDVSLADAIDRTPDWTRRARGYAVYAALRQSGRDGLAAMIDGCCRHAAALGLQHWHTGRCRTGSAAEHEPGIGAVPRSHGQSDADHDRHTDAAIAAINAEGTAFFSGTL